MTKTVLITGATDGIGLETAKMIAPLGHTLLVHGRSPEKLDRVQAELSRLPGSGVIETWQADFSYLPEVRRLSGDIAGRHTRLDVLINNAGVYKTPTPRTDAGYDVRFVVNTLAPALLTNSILEIIPASGRVVNLSSAAQSPVDVRALHGKTDLGDMSAYSQSKLALTMWTRAMAERHREGPLFVAVNPGSLLNTNMVREGWGGSDNDPAIGADILVRAAFSEEFSGHSGDYFDNDRGQFAQPYPDALDAAKSSQVIEAIEQLIRL